MHQLFLKDIVEPIEELLINNFIMCELFSDKNGFGTTVGTETSSSQGQPFGAGFQTELPINKRQQQETNQV